MKRAWLLPLCLLLTPCQHLARERTTLEVPAAVRADLDERFPGWQFPEVRDEIRKFLKERVSPDARAEFVAGDFDGNGEPDYAALVEHGTVYNGEGAPVGHNLYLVAYLKSGDGFKFHMVDPEGGGEYLVLMKKGEKDYDYETDRNFTYEHDAIFAGIFEKAGTSYVYEGGKFRAIVTSD